MNLDASPLSGGHATPARPEGPPLRVLHLVGAVEDNGGILTCLRNLMAASPPAAVEHVGLVNGRFQQLRRPHLALRRSAHLIAEDPRFWRHAGRAWRAARELRALLAAEPFDVLHAHGRGPFVLAALLAGRVGRPVIFTNHAYASRPWLYRLAARHPRLQCTVLTANMLRHYGLQPWADRIEVIPECGPDDLYESDLPPPPADGPIRLVGLGNLVGWKRWDLLFEALRRLPEALRQRLRCDLWGPVPDDPEARRFAAALRELAGQPALRSLARLAGPTPDGPARLREADWFVLPSLNEPCSLALLEALALGRPALVSASGGNVDIVQDGRTGLLFKPDDVASLTACLTKIAAGGVTLLPPAAIRESVAGFRGRVVAARYLALYRRLLPAGRAGTTAMSGPAAAPPTT